MEIIKPGLSVTSKGNHLHLWTYKTTTERDAAASKIIDAKYAQSIETCDVRSLAWATPNRADIDTGCKTFDKQCQGITTGNVMANTFLSLYIRPRADCKCNGMTFQNGELQAFDLKPFELDTLRIAAATKYIRKLERAEHDQLLMTAIFHHARNSHGRTVRVVHGAVITDCMLKMIKRFDRGELGLTASGKSCQVMDAVTPFLTDEIAINRKAIVIH